MATKPTTLKDITSAGAGPRVASLFIEVTIDADDTTFEVVEEILTACRERGDVRSAKVVGMPPEIVIVEKR